MRFVSRGTVYVSLVRQSATTTPASRPKAAPRQEGPPGRSPLAAVAGRGAGGSRFCLEAASSGIHAPVTARQDIARLSARLGLIDEEQDWGIVNGDAERLDEFAHIYARDTLSRVRPLAARL